MASKPEETTPGGHGSIGNASKFGFLIGLATGGIGLVFLLQSIEVIFVGGGIRELASLVIAGVFFSLGTFILVTTYVLHNYSL
jgi:hypothetical protein